MVACIAWWLVGLETDNKMMIAVTAAVIIVGTWLATAVKKDRGKDNSKVVIDEVVGMCISLLFVSVTIQWIE